LKIGISKRLSYFVPSQHGHILGTQFLDQSGIKTDLRDLEAECNGFAEKIQAFSGTVDMLVEADCAGEISKVRR
jgi:hypothetical protein